MSKTKGKKKASAKPFNFYGARKTSNPKYYSVTLVRGSDNHREWLNVPINKKNVKVKDDYILLKLSLLEDKDKDEDEDEDEDEDKDEDKDEDNLPF